MKIKTLIIVFFTIQASFVFAQDDNTKVDSAKAGSGLDRIQQDKRLLDLSLAGDKGILWSESAPDYIKSVSIGGYLRLCSFYRNMKEPYYSSATPNPSLGQQFFVGDVGYSEPLLFMTISGRASKNTSFSTDLNFKNDFKGGAAGGTLNSHFTVGFSGTMTTPFARFNFKVGGLHWYELTDLTLGSISKLDRYSIFERSPWEPLNAVDEKYSNFYDKGSISKDARWGRREFQGLILETSDLPYNMFMKVLYGKTGQNGDFTSSVPNNSWGGQIGKSISKSPTVAEYISVNTFNKITYSDSVQGQAVGNGVHTVAINKLIGKMLLKAEGGVGNYYSPKYALSWSEGIKVKLTVPEDAVLFPFEIQAYRIGKYFINENAGFANTTIREDYNIGKTGTSQLSTYPFTSSLTDGDDLSNNRQGAYMFVEKKVMKNIKLRVALGMAQELEKSEDKISFGHRVNSLIMNRVITGWDWWKGSTFGPYLRTYGAFRGVYEIVNITDSVYSKKNFSNFDFQLKAKQHVFGNPIYMFYNMSYKSAQPTFSPIPVFNNDAWLRMAIHEVDVYYQLTPSVILTGYVGYETLQGNDKTDLDAPAALDPAVLGVLTTAAVGTADSLNPYKATLKPRNQVSFAYAIGLDITLAKNFGLYIRQRWFDYKDKNFALDHFKGSETFVELKMFF